MTETRGFWAIAAEHPELEAMVAPDGTEISYGELAELTNRIANALRELGLGKGDQVSTLLPNGIPQIAVTLATQQIGVYITTINWHLVGSEIAYILADSETKVFFVDERFLDAATAAIDEVRSGGAELPPSHCVLVTDSAGSNSAGSDSAGSDSAGSDSAGSDSAGPEGFVGWEALAESGAPTTPPDRSVGSFMFYTSGTTGRPKGVRRPLPDTDPDEAAARQGGLFMLFGIEPFADNVQLICAPLYHTAVTNWAVTSLQLGHRIAVMDRFTPEAALEWMQRYRVTLSHMVPTMFHRMLKLPAETRNAFDLSSLRRMVHAAAPCPIETKHKMLDWWGPVIWEYYAATEGGGTIVSPEDWLTHPGTVGRAWPMSEVVIFSEEGEPVPTGESGTIYMRMGGAEFKYHNDESKTAAARLEGFFTVGDVGYFDEDGFLYLNDRATDMIIVGGVNVYPAEVEGVLHQHPKINDVAVFGIPNDDTGEEIKAVVEPLAAPGSYDEAELAQEIMDFVAERVTKQKWPHSIDFNEELPRDPNGKLYKRKLRDPYWEGRERAV